MESEIVNGRPLERILYNGKITEAQFMKDFIPCDTELIEQGDNTIAFSRWDADDVNAVMIKMTVNSATNGTVTISGAVNLAGAVSIQNSAEYEAYDLWANRYVANYVRLYKTIS